MTFNLLSNFIMYVQRILKWVVGFDIYSFPNWNFDLPLIKNVIKMKGFHMAKTFFANKKFIKVKLANEKSQDLRFILELSCKNNIK